MNYLDNYLKVIPKADANKIKESINENKEIFEVKKISEQEYELLINHIIENNEIVTDLIELDNIIKAEELNEFYSNVAIDLHKLFPNQNNIELLGQNYKRIYEGHLEELANEIEKIKVNIDRLSQKRHIQENVKEVYYSFEPDLKNENAEEYNENTSYLYKDRNGKLIKPAVQEKLFHTYHLSLNKTKEIDLLVNEKGISTAKIEVVYESPHTIKNKNPEYSVEKILDGDKDTFWLSTAHKPDNNIDTVNIMPGRTKEGIKYVRNK